MIEKNLIHLIGILKAIEMKKNEYSMLKNTGRPYLWKLLLTLGIIISFQGHALTQTFVYVKHDASGNNDGSSWADAYNSLETALSSAVSGEHIWVAAGTYVPENEIGGSGIHYRAFCLKNGVGVYGGFDGTEDPATFDLNERDFLLNETILSGTADEVYHVFRHVDQGLDGTALLNGFTITGGKADGTAPDNRGGGMLNQGSSSANGSSPTIEECVFEYNSADEGGAIYNSRYCSPDLSYTTFTSNTASLKGGAVFNIRNTPVFSYCDFNSNTVSSTGSDDGGGAMYNSTSVNTEGPDISYCNFTGNSVNASTSKGGAIFSYLNPGKISITHSTFTSNVAQYGGAIYHNSGSDANRDASDVQLSNCTIEENEAQYGAGVFSDRHHSILTSCILRGNEASEQAGAFYSRYASSKIINSLITGNKTAKHGGAAYFNADNPEIINTSISGNYAGERGGGISIIGGTSVELKNSILWGSVSPQGNELWVCDDCDGTFDYSAYGNATGDIYIATGGTVNATNSITSDPVFLNPLAPTSGNTPNILGNYFICGCTSPCIDAGLNSHVPAGLDKDLRNIDRLIDGNGNGTATVDFGAYEFDPDGCNALEPAIGDGSSGDPYQISMLQHLYWIAVESSRWDKHYLQTANIDACNTSTWYSGAGWLPIGNSTIKFTGTYDGGGYSISNLYINRPGSNEIGLFGEIDGISSARVVIKNLTLDNVTITGYDQVGALIGRAEQYNDIENCHVNGTVEGRVNVGGLTGWGRRTDFLKCSSSATVNANNISGAMYHGGLVGHINSTSTIIQCFASGDVSGRTRIGGLVGAVGWNSYIEDSYATGYVTGSGGGLSNPMIGGLAGEVWNAGIRRSYSAGEVDITGLTSEYGGLVGNKVTSSNYFDEDNFWDTESSGISVSEMGTGKLTSEMKTQSTFTNAGWNFTTTWGMDGVLNDGYAYLLDNLPPAIITWTGASSNDWNNPANWDNGVPSAENDVIIPDLVANDPVVDEGPGTPATCNNLSLESDATLTINAGKALTVTGNLSVANAKGPATLTVLSDASGTGSLIVEGTATGDIDFERYVSQDYWHFVSAPVSGQSIDNAFMTASGISNSPVYQFYRWDEDTKYWIIYGSTGNPEAFGDTEFVAGRGYALVRGGDGDLNFTGTPETSDVSYAATYTGTDPRAGFNLVGNPFSCALGISNSAGTSGKFLADNTALLDDNYEAAYIWDEQPGYAFDRNDYKVISNAAISGYTQLAQDYIQPGQAFMVKVVPGGGNIQFNTSMRAHAAVNFYKKDQTWPSVELLVQGDKLYNSTAIGFNDNMTTGLDPSYDVGKFKGNPDIALYTRLVADNGIDFALQALPVSNMEHFIVPVGIDISETGTFTFSAITDQLDEVPLILEDRLLGLFTDMKTGTYTADITESGTGRFFLRFKNTTGTGGMEESSSLQSYCAGKKLFINNPEGFSGMVTITDMAGRQVLNFRLTGDGSQQENMDTDAGIYIIHIITGRGIYRNKVLNF
jgi:hypothetical protein